MREREKGILSSLNSCADEGLEITCPYQLSSPRTFQSVIKFDLAVKEPREGWPLLIVETEVNGDSKSTNERGSSLVGF